MKYPQAGDLQRKLSTQLSNPAQKNPYEVRSPSGLEGVFANEGDAEFHADELRRSGVSGVRVERRERQRCGMARSNPSSDFGGDHPDWAKSNEDAVRDALARSSTEIANALKRHPEAVSSSERARYREGDQEREFFVRPDWKRVYVLTEYGIGDPVSYIDVNRAFGKAVEYLKRVTGEEWMWDSINPGKQMFVMLDEAAARGRKNPSFGYLMPIGASLRDELVEEIDSTDWDNVDSDGVLFADRAAKVKSLLLGAAKQGKGFVIDTRSLTSKDYEFLSDNLEDGVARNMKNIASSRGVGLGQIGRQIRDLREAIGRFGGVLPEDNPAGLTRKGERMYRQVKRGYQKRGEPRAAEIASRTVLSRAGSIPGLKSNPPGDLTYGHFYRTGGQDCANVISLDEFDLDLGTAEQIVADATSDWDDDLERDWRSQMDDEDFEGLDPHKAFAQWKAGWRAQAVRIIADRLKEREDEEE